MKCEGTLLILLIVIVNFLLSSYDINRFRFHNAERIKLIHIKVHFVDAEQGELIKY